MRLIDNFFVIVETSHGELGFITTIKLNSDHIIYSGHFPGHPVTPGVIQLQIVHELLEKHFSEDVRLITMNRCKFLKILNPNETLQLIVHVEFKRVDELLYINARGEDAANIFFKLSSVYQFI